MKKNFALLSLAALAAFGYSSTPVSPGISSSLSDHIIFGDDRSEQDHSLMADGARSEKLQGALEQPARKLLPGGDYPWAGGSMSFTMKIDPNQQNYFTVRFWGSEGNRNRLLLFCEGKQVGYRHLGDIDILDNPNDGPGCPYRFFYTTTPIPLSMTKGKTSVRLEIRSTGLIWGYGTNFDQYQKPMTEATRGIYAAYTHTESCFVPPQGEKQGSLPREIPRREQPGKEVLETLKQRVNNQIKSLMGRTGPLNQQQLWFLARTYNVKWTLGFHSPALVEKVAESIDSLYAAFEKDPSVAQSEKSMYNSDWFGVGPAGASILLLQEGLKPMLDKEIGGARRVTRRVGWSEMLVACRDWHREHRRQYTNQSMINDTFGIYLPNRAVALLTPDKALPEQAALGYLYESVGLRPWLGSDSNGTPLKPLGSDYFQLTKKGLTKELGFVGYYGEVLDWMTTMYNSTRPEPGKPGDPRLKAQLVKAAKARSVFRYPSLDREGFRAMCAETVVGWRDQDHYPGDVTYGQRPTWDGSCIESAAATLDPDLVAYARQSFDENQFFASVQEQMKMDTLRSTAGLISIPDDYETIQAQAGSSKKLPMSPGQPDFVFTDNEDGVLALKHGDEIFYVSLYWRARYAINFLAKVHHIRPGFDRLATVAEETQFKPSGMEYTRPDWINMGFANGGITYPGNLHSALAGEKLPIAEIPPGIPFKPGQESVYAGRGEFYSLRYGPYLIGMNTTESKDFQLQPPKGLTRAKELVSGKRVSLNNGVKVGPNSAVVLYIENSEVVNSSNGFSPR